MHIYSRVEWGARQAREMAEQGPPKESFLHHSDDPDGLKFNTLAKQKQKVRDIQNFHMDTREWSDIAYHFIVFQPVIGTAMRARAFEGRRLRFTPAAQLGHNTDTLAICVVGNYEHEDVRRNTRYAIEQIIKRYPSVKTLGGHKDIVSTDCPGKNLYTEIPLIARAAGVRKYIP